MASDKRSRNIDIKLTVEFDKIKLDLNSVEKLVRTVFNQPSLNINQTRKYEIHIAIVDSAKIRKLNSRFLNRDVNTDCLSFDLSDEGLDASKIFEVVVNAEKALEEANSRGHSEQAELALYITHGLLHNLGFDDTEPEKAKKMHRAEDKILQQLGYGLVYDKNVKK